MISSAGSTVKVSYQHCETKEQAYDEVIKQITPELLAKYNVPVDFDYAAKESRISAIGKGFKLHVFFYEDHLTLDLQMSLLLRPFRKQILQSLEKQLGKVV